MLLANSKIDAGFIIKFMTASKKISIPKSIIKMNTQTIKELRDTAIEAAALKGDVEIVKLYRGWLGYDSIHQELFRHHHKCKFSRRIYDELLPIAWHPDRVFDWCFDEWERGFLKEMWKSWVQTQKSTLVELKKSIIKMYRFGKIEIASKEFNIVYQIAKNVDLEKIRISEGVNAQSRHKIYYRLRGRAW